MLLLSLIAASLQPDPQPAEKPAPPPATRYVPPLRTMMLEVPPEDDSPGEEDAAPIAVQPMVVGRPFSMVSPITPVEGWDMSEAGCTSTYTANGMSGIITLVQTPRGDRRIVVAEPLYFPGRKIDPKTGYLEPMGRLTVAFGDNAEPRELNSWGTMRLSDGETWGRTIFLDAEELGHLRARPVLTFQVEKRQPVEVAIPSFVAAWRNVAACTFNQNQKRLELWPDDETPGSGPREPRPEGNAGRWLQYPSRALREAAQGRVVVAVQVNRYGYPTACAVTEASGHASLDTATCSQFMRRASFYPARSAQGTAVEGTYRSGVTWKIPD